MANYKIRGADQKEYGPVSAEVLRQWIAQGRVNAQTQVQIESSTEWQPLGSSPEFGTVAAPPSPPSPMPGAPAPGGPAKTSGLAIASLVLGLLGLCSVGITALVGLVLGIIALVKIDNSKGRMGGKGMAIAGICVSAVFLLFIPFAVGYLLPPMSNARSDAQKAACVANLKTIEGAKRIWALEMRKTDADVPTDADLFGPDKYIRDKPECPAAGTYNLGAVREEPTCTVPDHALLSSLSNARSEAQKAACVANLKTIEGAKRLWALEMRKTDADLPTDADLFGRDKYIRDKPECPAGGTYRLGAISEKPTCTVPNHAL